MSNFISIIIPVYNDPKGLRNTISTLIENNKALKNFEILVCNDGAGNNEITEINKLSQIYNFIKIINIVPNQGSYNARNEGIKIAIGDIIAFLDAGVFVQAGWYEEVVKNIENFDYLAGNVTVPLKWAQSSDEIYNAIVSFPVKHYLEQLHFGVTANLVVKKSVINEIGYFDGRLRSGGDMDFGTRVYEGGFKQIYLHNLKVFHQPRNLEETKKKSKRVIKGIIDLIQFYPKKYSNLKSRLSIFVIFKSIISKLFFPWRNKVYKSGLVSYIDFARIEIALTLNKLKTIREINSEK